MQWQLPIAAVAVYLVVRRPPRRLAIFIVAVGTGLTLLGAAYFFTRYRSLFGDAFDDTSRGMVALLATLKPGIGDDVWGLSIVNQAWLFFKYGLLWFLPNPNWMSIDIHPVFPLSVTGFPQLLGIPLYLGALVGSILLMTRYKDWRRLLGLGLFLPLCLFVTEFALVWIQDPFVLYRSYLWAIGVPLLGSLFLIGSKPRTITLITVAIGLVLCGLSLERVFSFKSEAAVWADAAAKVELDAPLNAVGRWRPLLNHGNQLMQQGLADEAAKAYAAASQMSDPSGLSDYHLGIALMQLGQPTAAGEALAKAETGWAMKADYKDQLNLQKGQLAFQTGHYEQAIAELDQALGKLSDTDFRRAALETRAKAHIKIGHAAAAISDFQQILQIAPGDRKARIGLAMSLRADHQSELALKTLDALLAEQDDVNVRIARILTLNDLGRRAAAQEELRLALAKNPDNKLLNAMATRHP